ncbi:MAG: site-2 protease family protein [Sedimentisphaerales bacterium]|jgi:regulator of sigma E protease|nr:site-2 protease family protein [Sedimentisphaerales bacterium]
MNKPPAVVYLKLVALIVAVIAIGMLVAENTTVATRIIIALAGFTAVVFIHECGHFVVAKSVGIKVQVFSIFLPPILVGIKRTASGYRIRILPDFFPRPGDPDDGLLSLTIGPPGQPGQTEYRIGLIPIAGYVKMLGQEDLGPDKAIDDPGSFGNKPIWARMSVIAAGVVCNVLAAILISSLVYWIGIEFPPTVVGRVVPGSPAHKAGLQPGDRIIEIAGRSKQLQPDDIIASAVLSDPGQPVPLTVERPDGSVARLTLVAQPGNEIGLRLFGIEFEQPQELVIANVDGPDLLFSATGLKPMDRIVAVNGKPVGDYDQFLRQVALAFEPNVLLEVNRLGPGGGMSVEVPIQTYPGPVADGEQSESELRHIYGLVPRLKVMAVQDKDSPLRPGDIIVGVADIQDPTFLELRAEIKAHAGNDLPITVLRSDPNGQEFTLPLVARPRRSGPGGRVLIGIVPSFDIKHPVIAKAIGIGDLPALPIPRGATITQIDDQPVRDIYDICRVLVARDGQQVNIYWHSKDGIEGHCTTTLENTIERITIRPEPAIEIPFKLQMELHKAGSIWQALAMGTRRSIRFVVQTYVTLKQLLSGAVKLQAMSGPVGIATIAYRAAERSLTTFLYMLAFISANLAVVNFLPLPVVDGGLFVMLIIEKIRGAPLSPRVQEVITYLGLGLIIAMFLYLTYNDLARMF